MDVLATILRDLGFLLYGGPLVAFAILVPLAGRLTRGEPWHVVRTWQAWGPGLGLSLGACVFGALWRHWLRHGAFSWGWASGPERLELAAWLAFFALWVSNIKLEIWTLEPLRKLDRDLEVKDPAAYRAALPAVRRHLAVHAALVVLVLVLAVVAEAA